MIMIPNNPRCSRCGTRGLDNLNMMLIIETEQPLFYYKNLPNELPLSHSGFKSTAWVNWAQKQGQVVCKTCNHKGDFSEFEDTTFPDDAYQEIKPVPSRPEPAEIDPGVPQPQEERPEVTDELVRDETDEPVPHESPRPQPQPKLEPVLKLSLPMTIVSVTALISGMLGWLPMVSVSLLYLSGCALFVEYILKGNDSNKVRRAVLTCTLLITSVLFAYYLFLKISGHS